MFKKNHLIEADSPNASTLEKTSYGMGWFMGELENVQVYSHGGNVETYSSTMTLLPEEELGMVILVSVDDMFSGQSLLDDINKGMVSFLTGSKLIKISPNTYQTIHIIVNLIFLTLVILSLIPIFRFKKWRNSPSNPKKILSILIHFTVPMALIFGIRNFVGSPIDVIIGFAPDVVIILGLFSFILFGTGLYKIFVVRKQFIEFH